LGGTEGVAGFRLVEDLLHHHRDLLVILLRLIFSTIGVVDDEGIDLAASTLGDFLVVTLRVRDSEAEREWT
jgi:hypothetical protein